MNNTINYFNIIPFLQKIGSPRFHGNGFVQLYLKNDIRLHIWHPDLPPLRDHNAMIHNHRYDMKSTVYAGILTHTIYEVDPTGEPDVRVIQLAGASDTFKKPKEDTGEIGKLITRHVYNFAKGSTYTMRRPYFHTSENNGRDPVVTIFERSNKGDEWAKVLCGINELKATHAFAPETQPSDYVLWLRIAEALSYVTPQFFERITEIFNLDRI